MAVHGNVEIGRWLVGVEIVESVLVDLEPVTRVEAQGAMIGKISVRQSDNGALPGLHAAGQVEIVVIAVPEETGFRDIAFGERGWRYDRRQPAFRLAARELPVDVDAPVDECLFFLRIE